MIEGPEDGRHERVAEIEERRAVICALTAGFASLVMPEVSGASDIYDGEEVEAPEPINPAIVKELVGRYELRLEWLFEGRVFVENPSFEGTRGLLQDDDRPEWIEHSKARQMPLEAEIVVEKGRLEVQTNFIWSPPGSVLLGPGAIFSTRVDGVREREIEGRGAMRFLRSVERDEYNQNLLDGVRHFQEWWIRHSSKSPWEILQTRVTTLATESPGMIVLRLNQIQSVGTKLNQTLAALRFKRLP